MQMAILPPAAVLLIGLAQNIMAKQPGKELAALEKKMFGVWQGGGCDGRLVLSANGRYKLIGYGPVNSDFEGMWKVRWDALPPTLVLIHMPDKGRTTKVKLIKLDDKSLTIEYPNPNGSPPGQYTRVKE
jgi:hypothetical protein